LIGISEGTSKHIVVEVEIIEVIEKIGSVTGIPYAHLLISVIHHQVKSDIRHSSTFEP